MIENSSNSIIIHNNILVGIYNVRKTFHKAI